jgi:hypothetical protein
MSPLEQPGPARTNAFAPFGPMVVLAATITVNGEPVTVQQDIDSAVWRHVDSDPPLRAEYERHLRYELAVALVDRITPTITVYEPKSVGEVLSGTLARADAAMRNVQEPEPCQSLELRSEA